MAPPPKQDSGRRNSGSCCKPRRAGPSSLAGRLTEEGRTEIGFNVAHVAAFEPPHPDKPLAYNIAWKTTIYVLIAMLVHYLERLVDFWREAGGFIAGNQKLLAEIVWPHFWAIQILLVVLILMYCTMREFARVIGEDKVRRMFFGPQQETRVA